MFGYPGDVDCLIKNIFWYINPKFVVIVTPNRDLNGLLGKEGQLRLPTHKFEWNRIEFTRWTHEVGLKYNYLAAVTGVGAKAGLDFCSLFGIFTRKSMSLERIAVPLSSGDPVVDMFVYEGFRDQPFIEKAKSALHYAYNTCIQYGEYESSVIPIKDLCRVPSLSALCDGSSRRLRKLIQIILELEDTNDFIYNPIDGTLSIQVSSDDEMHSDFSGNSEDF